MENILNSKEEQSLLNLFKLKREVYHTTFKNYVFIFQQLKNINFLVKINHKDIDFSNVAIDKNIANTSLQENISMVFYMLDSLNEELKSKIETFEGIVDRCEDFYSLSKEEKEFVKDTYFIARYIHILCTTNYYKYYIDNYFNIFTFIEEEVKPLPWLSFKIFFYKLLGKTSFYQHYLLIENINNQNY